MKSLNDYIVICLNDESEVEKWWGPYHGRYSHVISIRSSPFLLLHHEEQAPMENDANTKLSISTVKDLDPVR